MNDLLPEAPWEFSAQGTAFMEDAACSSYDPAYFDTTTRDGVTSRLGTIKTRHHGRVARIIAIPLAKAVCESCPVKARCLDFALEHSIPEGIWGGLLPDERQEDDV